MQTRTFELTSEVALTYDESSDEFREALGSYREMIDGSGDSDAMLKYVAGCLREWGDHERMIEGVGYVGVVGREVPESNYSGIQVDENYDQLNCE